MEFQTEQGKTTPTQNTSLSEAASRMEELKLQLIEMERDLHCLKEGYKGIEDRVNVLGEGSGRIPGQKSRNSA
jgi:hypothetical protein